MTRLAQCVGCGQLVAPGPRCAECRRSWARTYDAVRPAHHAVYRTAEWKRLSAETRAGATRCHWCLLPTRRLVADHVTPVEQRPDLALHPGNIVPACYGCNRRRGVNSKRPDLDTPTRPVPSSVSVGARMAIGPVVAPGVGVGGEGAVAAHPESTYIRPVQRNYPQRSER